jgi:hypothetical protein
MAILGGTHFVISASLTDTGAPVYLTSEGTWSPDLQRAVTVDTEAERDRLVQQALGQERLVCDPYFFDVRVEGGVIDPLSAREYIRAAGPTVRIRRPD